MSITILQITFLIILSFFTIIIHPCFVWNPFNCRWEVVCPIVISTTTTATSTITSITTTLKTTTNESPETNTTQSIIFPTTIETSTKIPINITAICEIVTSVVTSGLVPIYKYYDFWSKYCHKQYPKL